MFAVLYRAYLIPSKEVEYVRYWKIIADYFVKERGALGSTLHKTSDSMWIAYSRWPSREMRDASWPSSGEQADPLLPFEIQDAIERLKACLDTKRELPEIAMTIMEEIST